MGCGGSCFGGGLPHAQIGTFWRIHRRYIQRILRERVNEELRWKK